MSQPHTGPLQHNSTTTLTSGHWACIGVMRFTQRSYTFALQILSIPLMFLFFILPETKEDKDRPPLPTRTGFLAIL